MVTQNRFKTGLDIAKYTAIMRKDMAEYDANASNIHNQVLGMVLLRNKI
jgi:isocitrate lyase